MRCHLTLVRIAIIKKSTKTKYWRGYSEKRTLLHCWWECKFVQPLWKTAWWFPKKVIIELPYDAAIPLLGNISREKHDPKRYMQPHVHCSAVYNSQDMKANLNVHRQRNG